MVDTTPVVVVSGDWGIANVNGILTITDPVIADVVITEIMYNPPGANDYEWIEICNLNGTSQDLSSNTIRVNGTTRFTFPAASIVPANSCITVLLGHVASSPPPECPLTPGPDYQNPIGTTNYLFNTGSTIRLYAADGSTLIDIVAYDDADSAATDAGGSTFHFDTAFTDNSDTDTNWVAVPNGGSPGINSLISPCTTFTPEIRVETNSGNNIPDGAGIAPVYNNTFAATIEGQTSAPKTYFIINEGTGDLDLNGINVSTTEFTISGNPENTTLAPTESAPLTIVFSPSSPVLKMQH